MSERKERNESMTIDKDKLKELCSDPANKAKDIRDALDFKSDATFYNALNKDAEAKEIFTKRARKSRGGQAERVSARKAERKPSAAAAPPRNGNAKGRVSDELLRKIKHEFEQ